MDGASRYELGFHLTPDLDEAGLRAGMEHIEGSVSRAGGNITTKKEPRRTRLSYPIKHKRQSFFATVDFEAQPEIVEQLNKDLALEDNIMRFIILKHEDGERTLRSIAGRGKPRMKAFPAPSSGAKKPKEEVKPEVLEKQIEDVIEKL